MDTQLQTRVAPRGPPRVEVRACLRSCFCASSQHRLRGSLRRLSLHVQLSEYVNTMEITSGGQDET